MDMGVQWISVDDRLPETVGHSIDYLVCDIDDDIHVISWMNIGGWCWSACYAEKITHWSPLPKTPERKD